MCLFKFITGLVSENPLAVNVLIAAVQLSMECETQESYAE